MLELARSIVDGQAEEARTSSRSKWALSVLLAKVEAEVVDQLMITHSTRIRLAEDLRVPIPLPQRLAMARETIDLMVVASNRLEAVTTQARDAGDVQWEAISYLTFLESQIKRFALSPAVGVREEDETEREGLLRKAAATAGRMAEQFAGDDYRGLAVRARRLQGEAFALLSDEDGVARVRTDLEQSARRLGLHPNATQIVGPFQPSTEAADSRTLAQMWANEGPEMLSQIEDSLVEALALPDERRAVLRRDIHAVQRAYREQFDHCRHLLVLQDLSHTQSRDTYYERDPGRVAHCNLFAYESRIEDTDVDAIIAAFKRAYCDGCSKREPFER